MMRSPIENLHAHSNLSRNSPESQAYSNSAAAPDDFCRICSGLPISDSGTQETKQSVWEKPAELLPPGSKQEDEEEEEDLAQSADELSRNSR